MICSFCGKSRDEVAQLIIKKTASDTIICNECVGLCAQIVFDGINKLHNENRELENLVYLMEVGE